MDEILIPVGFTKQQIRSLLAILLCASKLQPTLAIASDVQQVIELLEPLVYPVAEVLEEHESGGGFGVTQDYV